MVGVDAGPFLMGSAVPVGRIRFCLVGIPLRPGHRDKFVLHFPLVREGVFRDFIGFFRML